MNTSILQLPNTENILNSDIIDGSQGGASNTPQKSQSTEIDLDLKSLESLHGNGLSVHIDWLAGVGVIPRIQPLIDFIMPAGQYDIREHPLKMPNGDLYSHWAISVNGLSLRWFELDDGFKFWVNFPGESLSGMGIREQLRLCSGLCHAYKMSCTRLDIALDDYQRQISDEQIIDAIDQGNVARKRKFHQHRSGNVGEKGDSTIYLGSDKKKIRRYNAAAKHDIDADRWELQLREDQAKQVFGDLCACPDYWKGEDRDENAARWMASLIVGAVDFVEKRDRNLSRCTRLEWYAEFIDRVGGLSLIPCPKSTKSIQRTIGWLKRQVSKSLAILKAGLQDFDSFLDELISLGIDRLQEFDIALINSLLE